MSKFFKYIEALLLFLFIGGLCWQQMFNERAKWSALIPLVLLSIIYFGFSFILFRYTKEKSRTGLSVLSGIVYSTTMISIIYCLLNLDGAYYLLLISSFILLILLCIFYIIRLRQKSIYATVQIIRSISILMINLFCYYIL